MTIKILLLAIFLLFLSPNATFGDTMYEIELIRQEVGSEAQIVTAPGNNCFHSYLVKRKNGSIWFFTVGWIGGSNKPENYIIRKIKIFHALPKMP